MQKNSAISLSFLLITALLGLGTASWGQVEANLADIEPYVVINADTSPLAEGQLARLHLHDRLLNPLEHKLSGNPLWSVQVEKAVVIGIYFKQLFIPGGDSLLIFGAPKAEPLWVFTASQTSGSGPTATPLFDGSSILLEYRRHPKTRLKPLIHIESIAYGSQETKSMLHSGSGPENSTACQVNVNCLPEGQKWQDVKQAVVRISLKKGLLIQLISGVLVNNTLQNSKPYLITSDNAMAGVSTSDLLQTVFYFNYELPNCDVSGSPVNPKTLTGATKVSSGGVYCNLGSDFFLMELNNYIPASYNPFFAGWDRSGTIVDTGVSIHFSGGLMKQIASFTSPLAHGEFAGGIPNTHWKVSWSSTPNGFSTTGAGGEGAPLLDKNRRLIGTYTGGFASCNNPQGFDYFGKFSVSWDQYGAIPETRLRDWLDPNQTGSWVLDGMYATIFPPEASLSYSDTSILAGDSLWFWDQSLGNPVGWAWSFPGGQPSAWQGQNPPAVRYDTPGMYDVALSVINAYGADSILLTTKIRVLPLSDTIYTYLDTLTACADTLLLPITVKNFYFVKSGSLTLTLDTARMKYLGFSSLHPRIQSSNPQAYMVDTDVWLDFNSTEQLYLGDDTLAVLRLLVDTGDIPLIWNTFRPWKCKYYKLNGQEFPVRFQDGLVNGISCAKLDGTLRYYQQHFGLASSQLHLVDTNGASTYGISDAAGNFTIRRLMPGQYQALLSTELPWGGGNATDALLILRHFAQLDQLSGLKLAAADVNGSGSVNATDALLVARRFASIISQFPASDWIIADTLIQLADGQYSIVLEAICRGDVNASRDVNTGTPLVLPPKTGILPEKLPAIRLY